MTDKEKAEKMEDYVAEGYTEAFGPTWCFPLIHKNVYLIFAGQEKCVYTQDIDLLIDYLKTARKVHLARANWEIYED